MNIPNNEIFPRTLALAVLALNLLATAGNATTLTVTSTADGGPGSLRQAILDANAYASPGAVSIEFDIPGSGVQTIAPLTPLPIISRAVTIDGYTQPSASPNTLANADNAVLLIELSGANLGAGTWGLYLAADGCTLRGLVINRFTHGLLVRTSSNVIEGNFIGTDATGFNALGNVNGIVMEGPSANQIGGMTPFSRNIVSGNQYGIYLNTVGTNEVFGNFVGVGPDGATVVANGYGVYLNNCSHVQVGGPAPGARNVISGNGVGLWLQSVGTNVIQGNFIGTDVSGTASCGNVYGIVLSYSANNLIGGAGTGEGNVISGNSGGGVELDNLPATKNVVAGNLIGTDVTGTIPLGNGDYGVLFQGAPGNVIGGTNAGAGNVICASHTGVGIYGLPTTNNAVLGNRIFGNSSIGIDLGSFSPADLGPTANDAADGDDGANHYQNFPEIFATAIGSGNMSVDYWVDSTTANSAYPLTVEFFIADAAGQGRTFIHRATYSTAQATEHITFVPMVMPVEGDKIVATATDANGNTSEFPIEPVIVIQDTMPPTVDCPPNVAVGCSGVSLAVVNYPVPTASDNLDPNPTVTCTPASGSASFPVGVSTVVCTAVDSLGNSATCSFSVSRAPLGFTGFLPPIGGEVLNGTGGTFADPVRAFKFGSTIPVEFQANCGGSAATMGVHTLQTSKYSSAVDSDPAIDATPTDAATTGNQFRLTDAGSGAWHFNLNTQPLSVGTWKLTATLSDGSIHEVWITIKK